MITHLDRYSKIAKEIDSLEREINNGEYDIPKNVRALPNKPDIIGGVKQITSKRGMAMARVEIRYIGRIADIKTEMYRVPKIMYNILNRKLNGVKSTYQNRNLEEAA